MAASKERPAPKKDNTEARIAYLERAVKGLISFCEKFGGKDIDGDGKVGGSRIGALAIAFLLSAGIVCSVAARDLAVYKDQNNTTVITLSTTDADDGDVTITGTLSASNITSTAKDQDDGRHFKYAFKETLALADFAIGSNSLESIDFPDNFVIDYGYIDILTVVASTNTGNTISIGLEADVDALKLVTTGNVAAGVTALVVDGTAGNAVKTTLETSPYVNVGVGTATSGTAVVYFEGSLSD